VVNMPTISAFLYPARRPRFAHFSLVFASSSLVAWLFACHSACDLQYLSACLFSCPPLAIAFVFPSSFPFVSGVSHFSCTVSPRTPGGGFIYVVVRRHRLICPSFCSPYSSYPAFLLADRIWCPHLKEDVSALSLFVNGRGIRGWNGPHTWPIFKMSSFGE
jgi:hypothetical protein